MDKQLENYLLATGEKFKTFEAALTCMCKKENYGKTEVRKFGDVYVVIPKQKK